MIWKYLFIACIHIKEWSKCDGKSTTDGSHGNTETWPIHKDREKATEKRQRDGKRNKSVLS